MIICFVTLLGTDQQTAEILINMSLEEPSWWVWVTDEMVLSNIEERSTIDNENYVIVSEESVVDGVANFMAKCVLSNPNSQVYDTQNLLLLFHPFRIKL